MTIAVRRATVSDAGAIARVKVATWRSAYAGIVPDDHLAALSVERDEPRWAARIERDAGVELVAETDGEGVVGFASLGPAREPAYEHDAELYAIYVLDAFQGRGVGRALFARACDELRATSGGKLLLWVLDGNDARGFYERLGGVVIGEGFQEFPGKRIPKVAYGFDLSRLKF